MPTDQLEQLLLVLFICVQLTQLFQNGDDFCSCIFYGKCNWYSLCSLVFKGVLLKIFNEVLSSCSTTCSSYSHRSFSFSVFWKWRQYCLLSFFTLHTCFHIFDCMRIRECTSLGTSRSLHHWLHIANVTRKDFYLFIWILISRDQERKWDFIYNLILLSATLELFQTFDLFIAQLHPLPIFFFYSFKINC